MSLRNQLAELADDDVDAIEATLASSSHGAAYILTVAMSFVDSRPALAFRVQAALARGPVPHEAIDREHWLRAHNNACYFAIAHGSKAEKLDVVERALRVAPDNVAIYHNAACVLCQLGERERALAAIADAVTHADEATIQAIAEDSDLDLIRHTEAFQQLVAGRGEFELPGWAADWTAWQVIYLRELVRSTLGDADLSEFAAGRVGAQGRELDIIELAQLCEDLPVADWPKLVHRHFVKTLLH